MEELTPVQQKVLDVIEAEIEAINSKLKKYEPLIAERNRLQQTRRVLLSEKTQTGGRGSHNAKITQEEVINWLRENGPATPAVIAEGLSVDGTVVRSHLNRHKETTYVRFDDGEWGLQEHAEED